MGCHYPSADRTFRTASSKTHFLKQATLYVRASIDPCVIILSIPIIFFIRLSMRELDTPPVFS
jgi:hypothetical protein